MKTPKQLRSYHKPTKWAVVGGALAALCGVLAACSSSPSSTPSASGTVTLTWWTWTTNPQAVISNFEKSHPGIKVAMPPDYGSGSTFYPKLTTAMAGGTGPCVTQIEYDHLPQYLAQHDLTPITQYVSSYRSDFPAWVWNQVSQNGQVYAMPEDIGPMALMYQPPARADHLDAVRFRRGGAAQSGPEHVPHLFRAQRRRRDGGAVVASGRVPVPGAIQRQLEG